MSLKGVTGAANLDAAAVAKQVDSIRAHTDLPVAVGFGIKDAASAAAVARTADGVVVGSALVQVVADATERGEDTAGAIAAAVSLVADIRRGIDNATS